MQAAMAAAVVLVMQGCVLLNLQQVVMPCSVAVPQHGLLLATAATAAGWLPVAAAAQPLNLQQLERHH
jgi:hypothetical protein